MDPYNIQSPKPPFKFTGERIALMIGGTLIGALAIVFGFKLATPIVKKACQSILEAPDKGDQNVRVASIEAIILKPGTISKRITTIGQLRANESVTLHTEMQGRIKEIAFKEGTNVKKGDILIRFEDEELQAELLKAEADVEYRQVKFNRMEKPEFKGFTKGHEYDAERGNLNIAKAAVELAKAKLAKATITAPFDGKIGLINVSVGAFVDTQKELVTIVDFDPMKIDFKIPEKFIHDIGVGQTAEIALDSFPEHPFQATVEAIDSRVDPQTHSIAVRATIPNEDGKLQTGLFGKVSVIIGVKNDALLVPESSLGREGDIEFVWVVVNGKAQRKRVLTSTKENGQAEVTAGLKASEIVVTSGQLKLGEGVAVKISNMGGGDVEVTDEDEDTANSKAATAPKKEGTTPAKEEATKPADSPKESKTDAPKTDTPKPDAPKTDAPVPSAPKVEEPSSKDEKKASDTLPQNQGADTKPDALPKEVPAVKSVAPLEAEKAASSDSKANETPPVVPTPPAVQTPSVSITPSAAATTPPGVPTPPTAPAVTQADPSKASTPTDASVGASPAAQTPPVDQAPKVEVAVSLEDPLKASASTKNTEEPGKVTIQPKEEAPENSEETENERSFFAKARDYVVNLFKRN